MLLDDANRLQQTLFHTAYSHSQGSGNRYDSYRMNNSMIAYYVLFNWSCIRAEIENEVQLLVGILHMRTI